MMQSHVGMVAHWHGRMLARTLPEGEHGKLTSVICNYHQGLVFQNQSGHQYVMTSNMFVLIWTIIA